MCSVILLHSHYTVPQDGVPHAPTSFSFRPDFSFCYCAKPQWLCLCETKRNMDIRKADPLLKCLGNLRMTSQALSPLPKMQEQYAGLGFRLQKIEKSSHLHYKWPALLEHGIKTWLQRLLIQQCLPQHICPHSPSPHPLLTRFFLSSEHDHHGSRGCQLQKP